MPHHGIGRGFKAGKEEIVGLLTALERFVKADDAADNARLEARLKAIAAELNGHKVTLVPASVTGRVPVLEIAVPDALALSARLQRGDPPVHLSERHAARGVLTLDPQVLLPEHDAALAAALKTVLGAGAEPPTLSPLLDQAAFRMPSCCSAVTPSSRPISSAILPSSIAKHGRAGEAHLAAGRRRQRADEEVVEGRAGVRAAAFPPADDIVALGDEVGRAAEVEVRERPRGSRS